MSKLSFAEKQLWKSEFCLLDAITVVSVFSFLFFITPSLHVCKAFNQKNITHELSYSHNGIWTFI